MTAADPLPAVRGFRVASPDERAGTSVTRVRDTVAPRLYSGALWRVDGDQVQGQRRDAITPLWWPLCPDLVDRWVTELHVLGPADPPLTADDTAAVADELAALVRAGLTATPRPVQRQSVDQSFAGRFLRSHEFWWHRDDLWWLLRTADPVRGGPGRAPEPPEPPLPTPGGMFTRLRRKAAPVGELVTPERLEAYATAMRMVQTGERPNWPCVLDELRKLVTP